MARSWVHVCKTYLLSLGQRYYPCDSISGPEITWIKGKGHWKSSGQNCFVNNVESGDKNNTKLHLIIVLNISAYDYGRKTVSFKDW